MAISSGRPSIFKRLKRTVNGNIENFFYWYGLKVAGNPWKVVLFCLAFVGVCSLGFFRFRQEKSPLKLWVPQDSDFLRDTEWIMNTFKEGFRGQYLLLKAPNVLEPKVLSRLEKIRKRVISFKSGNDTYEDVCFRIPAVKPGSVGLFDALGRRRRRSFFFFGQNDEVQFGGMEFDPSLYLSTGSYCNIVNKLPHVCLEMNLPQIWSNDDDELENLTLEKVIADLNSTKTSPVTGHPIIFPELLGGITRDDSGRIIGAKTLLSIWMTHVNFSTVSWDETGNSAGTSDWGSFQVMDWENGFLNVLNEEAKNETDSHNNLQLFYEAGRSFGDISGKSMFQDMGKLVIGIVLMFVFIQLVLPTHYNRVEMRLWLGCVGLSSILLSFLAAVGICSALGIPYGPVHTSLPFLMLGIGVDDMFVIMACWQNLQPSEQQNSLQQQIATALRHAGLSITVTSATDSVAFLIGSITILPCLQSFCLYTAIGILIMYFFQATLFVAFLALDARRTADSRNCLLFCISHRDYQAPMKKTESLQSKVFGVIYDKFIFSKPVKIIILMGTLCITGVAIKGNLELKQRFEPEWFLPNNSYLLQYINQRKIYYPDLGRDASIFVGRGNYSNEFRKIHNLAEAFGNETGIIKTVDSWTYGFITYTLKAENLDMLNANVTEEKFRSLLSTYLWSPSGARFQKNFRFNSTLRCGQPAPPIEMSSIDFIFRIFSGPEEYLPATNHLKKLVKDADLPHGIVWGKIFANWVTDEVIDKELYRNIGMAIACVMLCTAVLVMDFQICFWIFMCVLLTVVDVAGYMYFWGMSIDIATCVALVLAVGLCVDFAAHIGHTFLRLTGTRHERAVHTVKFIGTASANGAFSTLLALFLLGFSDAYIFTTFFKIFFLVIIFGIFHGVVCLPVVLSLVGPDSYNESSTHNSPGKEMVLLKKSNGATVEETERLQSDDEKQ